MNAVGTPKILESEPVVLRRVWPGALARFVFGSHYAAPQRGKPISLLPMMSGNRVGEAGDKMNRLGGAPGPNYQRTSATVRPRIKLALSLPMFLRLSE